MGNEKISGGYYIKARKVQLSAISCAPPHVREMWDYFLMSAVYAETSVRGITLKRGQWLCDYNSIREGLAWFVGSRKVTYNKGQIERGMKHLKKTGMVTTQKTTRGIIVTVTNYSHYQNPENYENYTKGDALDYTLDYAVEETNMNKKKERRKKYIVGTHPLLDWLHSDCPTVQKMDKPITLESAQKIFANYNDKSRIRNTFLAMENHKPLTRKYKDAYSTFSNWYPNQAGGKYQAGNNAGGDSEQDSVLPSTSKFTLPPKHENS